MTKTELLAIAAFCALCAAAGAGIRKAASVLRRPISLARDVRAELGRYGSIIAEAARANLRAAIPALMDLGREYLPLLRSRTLSNATALKFLAIFGFLIPPGWHNILTDALWFLGVGVTFANIVQGRKNASGPLVTPRDNGDGGLMGPGAASELDAAHRFGAWTEDQLRDLATAARAELRLRANA